MDPRRLRLAVLLAAVAVALGCGDSAESANMGGADWEPGIDTGDYQGGGARDASDAEGGDTALEPEKPEEEANVSRPTASRRYVFVANRSLDSVAKIDSVTLAVTPIPVGREPTVVRTSDEGDTAAVLNVGSDSVSIIEARPDGDEVETVDVIRGCNQLAISPAGTHVVAWYDNHNARVGDRIGSLQEVSVVDLAAARAFDVSVGFNIRGVEFDAEGSTAFVITDTGVNVIDLPSLDADVAIPGVGFGDDPLVTDIDREVAITDGGAYAVLRSSSHDGIRVVNLDTSAAVSVELPGTPTDIDLLAGDTTAIVALRELGELAVLDLATVIEDPTAFTTVAIDAPTGLLTLTADQAHALTYTTVGGDRRLGVVTLDGTVGGVAYWLSKSVRSVLAGPDASMALVVHASEPGQPVPGEDIDDFVAKAEAVSLFDLSSGYSKLVLLDVEPDDIVFTPDGTHAVMMLADEATGTRDVMVLDTDTFATRTITMEAMPESVGVVPGTSRVFVSQRADAGRITFVDTADGSVRHVSAFQLNAYID